MEKLFLIDTNVWVGILREDKYDYLLKGVQQLIDENKIKLLVPSVLLQEWSNEKNKQLVLMQKTYSNTLDVVTASASHIIRPQLQNEHTQATKKAEKIDYLLKNGISYAISKEVKSITMDRMDAKLAPFHSNPKSFGDCKLYFSTIEYLTQHKFTEFVFVTKNLHDFGDSLRPAEILHPDLNTENVHCDYFTDLGRAFFHFKNELPLSGQKTSEKPRDYKIVIIEPQNYSILTHLHKTLVAAREQLEFIPIPVLMRLSPLRIEHAANAISYYSQFSLNTNNEFLFQLFDDIEIKDENVTFKKNSYYENTAENLEMLRDILNLLNQNHVHSITSIESNRRIDILIQNQRVCDCPRCCYDRLEFSRAFEAANQESQTSAQKMKAGYVFYQLGFYDKAIIAFYDVYNETKISGQLLLRYRAAHNLIWLRNYVSSYTSSTLQKIAIEIHTLNEEKEYYIFANASPYELAIASFYHQTYFNYHYSDELNEDADKISSHFESQLRNGYGNNTNYWSLLSHYAEYASFISLNCLSFSKFTNFKRVFSKFAQSFFYCLNLNQYQTQRPEAINDYTLLHMVFYGDPKELVIMYRRLSANQITYEPDADGSKFEEYVYNFFDDNADIKKIYIENQEGWNDFRSTYENIFTNIVLLTSIVAFKKRFIRQVAVKLLQFLENNTLRHYTPEYIASFISKKSEIIPLKNLFNFLHLFIKDEKFHQEDMFASFPLKRRLFVISTQKDFELITATYLDRCLKCGRYHSTSLYSIYYLLSPVLKQRLRRNIEQRLDEKFDVSLYYHAAIRDLIQYKKYFKKYISLFSAVDNKSGRNPFIYGEIQFIQINELINLVFKNNIRLSKQIRDHFKNISPYYDWLLNLKTFDYSKFNPLWIQQYATSYYLLEIFKIKDVRRIVKEYVQNNYQPLLAGYYTTYVD